MRKIAFILLINLLVFSCSNSEEFNSKSACGVENPVEDLTWLKDEIEQIKQSEYQYSYVKQNVFENQDVFIYGNCDPLANSVAIVYNCNGEQIGFIGDEKFSSDLLSKGTVIWKSKDSKCDL